MIENNERGERLREIILGWVLGKNVKERVEFIL